MAGEQILVIDDSAAERSIVKHALENRGWRVTVGGNGSAALLEPDFKRFDLVILDATMAGVDGLRVARELRADPERGRPPILLLVDAGQRDESGSVEAGAADAWLVKPCAPEALVAKVEALLDLKAIRAESEAQTRAVATRYIAELCDRHVRQAIEDKTQLLAERAIQAVVNQVDQQARREVDQRVNALTAEKEQELVRVTVREVANSMIEKLAERKVTEAMETILREQTDLAVRRGADAVLPGVIRERLKEAMDNIIQREIELRVRQTAEALVPGISEKILDMVNSVAQRIIPRMAREQLPDITQRQVSSVAQETVPRMVEDLVARAVRIRMAESVDLLVKEGSARIHRAAVRAFGLLLIISLVVSAGMGWVVWQTGRNQPRSAPAVPAATESGRPATAK